MNLVEFMKCFSPEDVYIAYFKKAKESGGIAYKYSKRSYKSI